MLSYIWPIGLVVLSNVFYQICTKSVPPEMDPLASVTITYLVGAAASLTMYFVMHRGHGNLMAEFAKLNWAPVVLGVVIVGLEVGYICAYKAGWQVSMAAIVQSSFLAVALLFVGMLLYNEELTINKCVGVAVCLVGLYILNR